MSVQDMIKKSVLESGMFSQYDVPKIFSALAAALILGCVIYLVYQKFYVGVIFSRSFGVTLVGMTVLTCMVTLAISSNIVISLGMVGALSIVRFRTAVKEPVDTGFMFWGIAAGIMAGAGLYIPAMVATLGIGVLYFLSYLMGFKTSNRYLLVIKYKASAHETVLKKLKTIKKFKIRSKAIFGSEVELSLEVDVKENKKGGIDTALVDQFNGIDGVVNASLIAYQNDFGS